MTDMDTAAGEGLRRRRGGGREGHARHAAPQQPPWAQPRLRYRPTELLSADELESIHIGSLRVLSEIGMDFLDADAREVLRAAGATVEPGSQRVRFDPAMVTELIKTAPTQFTLHARNPARHVELGGDWVAFGTVGSPPNVADLDRGRRIGNRADYQNLLRPTACSGIHWWAVRTSGVSRGVVPLRMRPDSPRRRGHRRVPDRCSSVPAAGSAGVRANGITVFKKKRASQR